MSIRIISSLCDQTLTLLFLRFLPLPYQEGGAWVEQQKLIRKYQRERRLAERRIADNLLLEKKRQVQKETYTGSVFVNGTMETLIREKKKKKKKAKSDADSDVFDDDDLDDDDFSDDLSGDVWGLTQESSKGHRAKLAAISGRTPSEEKSELQSIVSQRVKPWRADSADMHFLRAPKPRVPSKLMLMQKRLAGHFYYDLARNDNRLVQLRRGLKPSKKGLMMQLYGTSKKYVGSASALVTFICVLCCTLRTQISRSINATSQTTAKHHHHQI
jgi:hypothetical protein